MKVKLSNRVSYSFMPQPYQSFKFDTEISVEKDFDEGVSVEEASKILAEEIKPNIKREIDVSSQEYLISTENKKALFNKALNKKK